MGQIQSLDELIGLLLRRKLLIMVIVCTGMVLSVIFGLSRPKVFESGAVIQVEMPVVEGSDAGGSQSAKLLQSIEQRLTTRDNLLSIIERHGLFADAPGLNDDQKVTALRSSVTFQSVAATGPATYGAPASVSALIIAARLGDGDQAARVANDFAQSVLDLSSAEQAARARETLAFYQQEAARISADIAQVEADLAMFKSSNQGALPQARDSGREEISALESELRRIQQEMLSVKGQQTLLTSKERLRETDKRQLADLQAQQEVLAAQMAALDQQISGLRNNAAQTPDIERDLASFDRRLQQLQSQYESITTRQAEAETNMRLEQAQQAERFTLLERALVPQYALGSGGKKLALLGSVASLFGALLLAFGLDLLHPVVRSSAQMERQLGLRPVIAIPELPAQSRLPAGILGRLSGWFGLRRNAKGLNG